MSHNSHKRNYTVEPQKRVGVGDAGWMLCPPSEAERFAIVELTIWHQRSKRGPKRQFRKHRVIETFDKEADASAALAILLRRKG